MGLRNTKTTKYKEDPVSKILRSKHLQTTKIGILKIEYKSKTLYPTVFKYAKLLNPNVLKYQHFVEFPEDYTITLIDDDFFIDSMDGKISFLYRVEENGNIRMTH